MAISATPFLMFTGDAQAAMELFSSNARAGKNLIVFSMLFRTRVMS